jgi:hypothetical protein
MMEQNHVYELNTGIIVYPTECFCSHLDWGLMECFKEIYLEV